MAMVKKGAMMDGMRGRVGDLVFRVRGDQTIVSCRPRRRKRMGPRSRDLERTLSRFRKAVRFAREARNQHAFRSLSRLLGGYSPYHVAVQDYLSDPTIETVDASRIGPAGGELVIRVSERVAVRSVRVRLLAPKEIATGPTAEMPVREEGGPVSVVGMLEESEVEPPAATVKPKEPIPAALFFRRVSRPEKTGPVGEEDDAKRVVPERPQSVLSAARVEARATRWLVAQRRRRGESGEERLEIWRVALPRAGWVEIIASDYAGNRAVKTLQVGPPMGR